MNPPVYAWRYEVSRDDDTVIFFGDEFADSPYMMMFFGMAS